MFSNHHEIMLILIFTSKLPREWEELLLKKNPTICQSPLMWNTCLLHLGDQMEEEETWSGVGWGFLCTSNSWHTLCTVMPGEPANACQRTHCLRLYCCFLRNFISFERASDKSIRENKEPDKILVSITIQVFDKCHAATGVGVWEGDVTREQGNEKLNSLFTHRNLGWCRNIATFCNATRLLYLFSLY